MEEIDLIEELILEYIEFETGLPFAWPAEDEPEDDDETLTIELRIEIESERACQEVCV